MGQAISQAWVRQKTPALRDEAVRSLQQYVSDTLKYIDAVQKFIGGQKVGDWRLQRKAELSTLKEITKLANRVLKQKELCAVLKNIWEGMEALSNFLDAVEKLAVTSLQLFTGGELKLSLGIPPKSVEDIISAARLVCPLLLRFKRDASGFFQPSLHNLAIFEAELDKYIDTAEKIFTTMERSTAIGFEDRRGEPPLVEFAKYLTSDVLQNIIVQVNQLSAIREDPHFRLVYLFQEKSVSGFVNQFSECQPKMFQFLDELEDCAVQLDRMKTGSEISRLAGSSVGVIGGVMSIVGVVVAPVTAGLSLGLTMGGLGLGITSGVNGAVTTVMEIAVNKVQKKKASEGLQSFMQNMNNIQACLDEVTNQREETLGLDIWDVADVIKVVNGVRGIGSDFFSLYTVSKAPKTPKVAQQAAKGTWALSKVAGVAFNVLFIGMDILTICKDGASLARGGQSELSEFIRDRAALLRSEVDCWRRIHDSVRIGMQKFESGKDVLNTSFRKKK